MRLQTVRNKQRGLGSYWSFRGPLAKPAPVLEMFSDLCVFSCASFSKALGEIRRLDASIMGICFRLVYAPRIYVARNREPSSFVYLSSL